MLRTQSGTIPRSLLAPPFDDLWSSALPQVRQRCLRLSGGDAARAEEVVQRVGIRAWRGFSSLQDHGAFLAWALRIADREHLRLAGQEQRQPRHALPDELAAAPPARLPAALVWVTQAIQAAGDAGHLGDTERLLLLARVQRPEATWEQIGAELKVPASTCAVFQSRARDRLRVFLFLDRPDLLGGQQLIDSAFEDALADPKPPPLAPQEAQAFRSLVVERRGRPARGNTAHIVAACRRVIRHVPLPFDL